MKNTNMKDMIKRMIAAGLITTMMITPTAAFAGTETVPEAPEMPVAESYEDNAAIEEYNAKVDDYNASVESYNKAVDEEYDAAVAETNRRNEEIASHNAAEEQRVSDARARNEQAVKDAEERNRQIDEENETGRKAAEEARDAKYESDLAKYNEDIEQYNAKAAQYEADVKMEARIKAAGYQSVQQYNDLINTHYNEPAKKSVEKNANAPQLGITDTYSIEEAEVKSGRMIKVTIEHNFYDTDLSYKEVIEIDANDTITFKSLGAPAENTNPGYATFYYNTDEDHSMGYWMESDSYVATNASVHDSGWDCGDTHVISFKDGTVRAGDIEDIEVVYNYAWMGLRTYTLYNVPEEPETPEAPVKGEIEFEAAPYVEPQLEDIIDADILAFITSPEKKAYMDFLNHMDLFEVPEMPEPEPEPETEDTDTPAAPVTPETPDAPKTPGTPDSPKAPSAPKAQGTTTTATTDAITPAATPAAPAMTTVNAPVQNNGTATFEDGEAPLAAATETEEITDGQTAKAAPATAWALINLIAAIITVVIAAIVSILGLKKKDEDEDEEKEADRTNRKPLVRGLGVITAIVSVIAFILTEDMSLPMQLTDQWTLMMVIILAVEAVLGIAARKTTRDGEEKQTNNMEAELA